MSEFKVGDMVLSEQMNGVIVAISRKKGKALVCNNHFAAMMIRDFGVTLDYVRSNMRCKSIPLSELQLDSDDDDE